MTDKLKPGRFVKADISNLAGGKFAEALNELMDRVVSELEKHEKRTGELGGKVGFSITGSMKRTDGSDAHLDLSFDTTLKLPKHQRAVMVRAGGGMLLFDPEDGDGSLNDSDQMVMETFDRFGKPQAVIDRETGEVKPPAAEEGDGVVGRVG